MPASPEVYERVQAWIAQQFPAGMRCALCQYDAFSIDGPAYLRAWPGTSEIPDAALAVIPVICGRCQFVFLLRAEEIGVT